MPVPAGYAGVACVEAWARFCLCLESKQHEALIECEGKDGTASKAPACSIIGANA